MIDLRSAAAIGTRRASHRRVRAFKDGPLAARRRARIRLCGKCGASTTTAAAKGGRRWRGRCDVRPGERRPLAARGTAPRRGSIAGGRMGRGGGLVALGERPRPAGTRARPGAAARLAPAARAATIQSGGVGDHPPVPRGPEAAAAAQTARALWEFRRRRSPMIRRAARHITRRRLIVNYYAFSKVRSRFYLF